MNESDFNYDSRQEDFEECAEARRVSQAHAPSVEGEPRAVSAPNSAAQFFADFFDKRAIDHEVGKARPYRRYEMGDKELVGEYWPMCRRHASRVASQASGVIIPRRPPPALGAPTIPAELRPDEEVWTERHYHWHGWERNGELVIPTSGKRLWKGHIHSPEEMENHIQTRHDGVNVNDVHWCYNWAKYVFPTGDGAMRIDMHPQALVKFWKDAPVAFGIEGCIKADAMLSAGWATLSVPAVWHWMAPELARVARWWLREKKVYVIPDADLHNTSAPGHTNVSTAARLFQTYLLRLGVDARLAAPPADENSPRNERGKLIVNGVDDLLAAGGTMSDLMVSERKTHRGLAEFLADRNPHWLRKERTVRNAKTMEALARHADNNGEIRVSLRMIARIMGVHHQTVASALRDLEDCGVIAIDGSLEIHAYYDWKKDRYVGWEWRDKPAIHIIPELQAEESVHRLGDE